MWGSILSFITSAWGLGAIAAAVAVLVLIGVLGRTLPFWVWVCVIAALGLAIFAQRAVTDGVRVDLAQANTATAREQAAHQATRAAQATQLQRLAEKTLKAKQAVDAWTTALAAQEKDSDQKHHAALLAEQQKTQHWRDLARSRPDAVSVRVNGAVCAPGPARPTDLRAGASVPAASSLGDGAVEVTGAFREGVFDLRDSIASDREKLGYLQDFARQCAGAGPETP